MNEPKRKDHSLSNIRVREVAPGRWEASTKIRVVVSGPDPSDAVRMLDLMCKEAMKHMVELHAEVQRQIEEEEKAQGTLPGTDEPGPGGVRGGEGT